MFDPLYKNNAICSGGSIDKAVERKELNTNLSLSQICVCLFVCLFGVLRPTREFLTHFETSPLPAKGYKFLPLLGTHDN